MLLTEEEAGTVYQAERDVTGNGPTVCAHAVAREQHERGRAELAVAVAAERERWRPLAEVVAEAEADREDRGKSTITNDYWDGIVEALERAIRAGAPPGRGSGA